MTDVQTHDGDWLLHRKQRLLLELGCAALRTTSNNLLAFFEPVGVRIAYHFCACCAGTICLGTAGVMVGILFDGRFPLQSVIELSSPRLFVGGLADFLLSLSLQCTALA
jgi:hypothetical protein